MSWAFTRRCKTGGGLSRSNLGRTAVVFVVDGFGRLLAVRGTLNDQLRTGTDKGNLTV